MLHITKQQSKLYYQAMQLVHSDLPLTFDQKEFILQTIKVTVLAVLVHSGA